MSYEEETEFKTCYYRCIDPIENLKIKVILQPIKNLHIPLPQFEKERPSPDISPIIGDNQSDSEEYTFKWQEKVFSKHEIKTYSSVPDWKSKLTEKYSGSIRDGGLENFTNNTSKLFSYVDADNYFNESDASIFTEKIKYKTPLDKNINGLQISEQNVRHYKNIPKRKIITYNPTSEFKNRNHFISRHTHRMFIMIDLGSKVINTKKGEQEEICESVLCSLSYDFTNNILQVTPAFSESKLKPYTVGWKDSRHSYYYWVYHASETIPVEDLTKELKIMSKVFDHQEEIRRLQLDSDFFIGKPNHLSVTVLGEIVSAKDFEYDQLHVHYLVKTPSGWEYSDSDALVGRTQSSFKNSQGICYFSHLFEMNFLIELKTLEDSLSVTPELFFEVLSMDKYRRYRNEGYTYLSIPMNPGIYKVSLNCWRTLDKSIRSQLERFFIGGGPELEDVSCIGVTSIENAEVMSRFGLETAPSGKIDIRLNILHQSEVIRNKKGETELDINVLNRLDAGSLLGSVNTVLEAFRKARERMLQAKKGLESELNYSFPEIQNDFEKKVTILEPK